MTQALRDGGVRVTRQREALLRVLSESADHPDATELHRRAQVIDDTVSLATVYRTLTVLEREGVIHRHSFENGSARFEVAAPGSAGIAVMLRRMLRTGAQAALEMETADGAIIEAMVAVVPDWVTAGEKLVLVPTAVRAYPVN